jgi:1A family penicillin-binding protein
MLFSHRSRTRSHKKVWWKRHLKVLILLIFSLFFICGGLAAIWFSTLQIPDLSAFEARQVAESTKIYDRTGEVLLYDIHSDERRTVVPFDQISPYIKNATISIEDDRFYQHHGIEPTAILRAMFANITGLSASQGGSTITQQVIKNSVLTKDKTLTRKLKEWVLAVKLERILTKDQIFETYLNENPYGGNIYGVEEASKTFFGKSAKDVTIAEAAYIAAIPQAPTYYSPYGKNKDKLDQREHVVLSKMKEFGYITDAEYNAALKEKVTFLEKNTGGIRAPHFAMYVKDYLDSKYGEDVVDQGGLKVITTLDYSIQEKAENVVKRFAPTLESQFNASNTAMVAVNPKNGDILMMVGSRDYFDKKIDGNFNVTTALRQPGSTFKPFVYATAFMKGYTPDTVLFDIPTEFSSECNPDHTPKDGVDPKKCYSPVEYDNAYPGPMSIREALAHSRNIPAVKTLYLTGIKDSLATARAMGITSLNDPDRYGLTLVLGGGEVSLLELTSAYSVFANDGVRNPYRSILRVEDRDGNVLEEAHDYPNQAIPTEIARQINDILSDTKVRMTSLLPIGESLRDKPVAIKTGTTNDYRDVWIEGYTPNIAVGAWAGRNDNTPMSHNLSGLVISPLWGAFMAEINDSIPKEYFKKPEPTPSDIKPVLRGIWKGGQSYFIDSVSKKLATPATPPELRQEVVIPGIHTILQWVDKNDPRGPIPQNPGNDSQYASWEWAIQKWKTENNITDGAPVAMPTASDDIHTNANAPHITITAPTKDAVIKLQSQVVVNLSINSAYPIKKSELYVNDRYIYTNEVGPNTLSFTPKDIGLSDGTNTIKVVVYDSALNKGEATQTITLVE